MEILESLAPIIGLCGLICALIIFVINDRRSPGNEAMCAISNSIHDGAMAFLKREYSILLMFIIAVTALISWQLNHETAVCFITGALCSILAGFIGMKSATRANTRTSEAARSEGIESALTTAFQGGAVMGLALAGLGLLGVGVFAQVFAGIEQAVYINGFAMGASSIALFARVGGGIYTKAADVGSDLVGKVEAGIPEDDPRNPGVIADNVGDNVGDVAGMGADIFESYVGSMIATMAIAATLGPVTLSTLGGDTVREALMALPLVLAGIGLICSLAGIISMRIMSNMGPAGALRYSTWLAAALFLVVSYVIINGSTINDSVFWAILAGALGGVAIGYVTEYYTSMKPVMGIANASTTGAATNIIEGLASFCQRVGVTRNDTLCKGNVGRIE